MWQEFKLLVPQRAIARSATNRYEGVARDSDDLVFLCISLSTLFARLGLFFGVTGSGGFRIAFALFVVTPFALLAEFLPACDTHNSLLSLGDETVAHLVCWHRWDSGLLLLR